MEKKGSNNSKRESSYSAQKIFGNNKLEIGEDGLSNILGGVLEKGVSDKPLSKPSSHIRHPNPTVMPFPVARHRSHGPHWGPVASDRGKGDDNDEDDDEDDTSSHVDQLAALANPVQRKERKGLNFSRWRELMSTDDPSVSKRKEKNLSHLGKADKPSMGGEGTGFADKRKVSNRQSLVDSNPSIPMEVEADPYLNSCAQQTNSEEAVTSGSHVEFVDSVTDMELDNSNKLCDPDIVNIGHSSEMSTDIERMSADDSTLPDVQYKSNKKPVSGTTVLSSRSSNFESGQQSVSLESEIDAENRARLQRMSPDEIAQAKAEIMKKMNPALLNILKKRGMDKTKKQESTCSLLPACDFSSVGSHESQSIQDAKGFSHCEDGQNNNVVQSLDPADGNLWNIWSERVEAVREIKFSLDGSVVQHEFIPTSKGGNNSIQGRQSADKVVERDILRTEGDPAAEGYTIKEAMALTRSVVSGHRVLGLRVLASVLDSALHNIYGNRVGRTLRYKDKVDSFIDWEAVWAYALGPEPELVLSLRMRLDDNHYSVVLECLRVLRCSLSCDLNEHFFYISQKIANFGKDIYTAPVFRRKPEINLGFLHGGFWKYSVKPSNIIPSGEDVMSDETEGKFTIQDDIVIAGQDFAAGLVRMNILVRLRYLLETDPTVPVEECIMSILIAIARHSPICASAIMKCERLVQTIVRRFTQINDAEFQPLKMKSVCLLKVLAQSDKKNCTAFLKNGTFEAMTWHLYRPVSFFEQWVKLGREQCKLSSDLMVEQLRFWKVCIQSGYCISYFADMFPALCLWLNPPSFEKLIENDVLSEFASVSSEVYLVLEALAVRLPKFYSQEHPEHVHNAENWSWSYVRPTIDSALKWLCLKNDLQTSKFFERQNRSGSQSVFQELSFSPLLWVYSSIMFFLSRVLERVTPEDTINLVGSDRNLPWLPDFVPNLGLEMIKSQFLSFDTSGAVSGTTNAQGRTFLEELCHLRQQIGGETSLASVSLLHGLVRVIFFIDKLIQLAKPGSSFPDSQAYSFSREEKILEDGILKGSVVELKSAMKVFGDLITSEWYLMQSNETFGRGGPSPGVGLGWGASGGGFWSTKVLLAQADARFLLDLLEILQMVSFAHLPAHEQISIEMQIINAALGICLIAGPRDKILVEKALDILLQVPVLRSLDLYAQRFLQSNKRMKWSGWEYKKEDYLLFSKTLASHFRSRWLSVKRKSKSTVENINSGNKTFKKGSVSLDTIQEDSEESANATSQSNRCMSLAVEWAHQRLPLPSHWFLSPISTISDGKDAGSQNAPATLNYVQESNVLELAKAGLFFILGIEAMATLSSTDTSSPVQSVPLFWKFHSLTMLVCTGMSVIEDERSRDVLEALQEHYGKLLDEALSNRSANLLSEREKKFNLEILRFQSELHDSYTTFIGSFVEQFAAVSYGDIVYGRQVAVYLHRSVEAPTRLAAWNALSNARALELLPPIEECISAAKGYLEPLEDNEEILQAYMKSWTSGALDKAVTRGSMSYTLVLHHLSSLIFLYDASDKSMLRNRFVKSLLRDCSRERRRERMMLDVVRYSKPSKPQTQLIDIEKRFEVLKEVCQGTSSLLNEVEKLKSSYLKD